MNLKNSTALKAELPVSEYVPYVSHIARDTVKLESGDYLRVFKLDGIAHESADDEDINMWHNQLNMFLRNIASPNVALWSHIIRRREQKYPAGDFAPGFTADLDVKYKEKITSGEMMLVNELYLSVLYRPRVGGVGKAFSKLENMSKEAIRDEQAGVLEKLDEIGSSLVSSLARYDAVKLAIYDHAGIAYSEIQEFLAFLLNGEWQRMPLARQKISTLLPTSRPFFGKEALALHTPTHTIYGSILSIKEYPAVTGPGILDCLLNVPYELILTQSFIFLPKQEAIKNMTRQRSVMTNAGDLAQSQIDEIDTALDDITSNRYVMGQYHFSLLVLADDPKSMRDAVGATKTALQDTGMVIVRDDLANEAAFWAQLPGNFKFRTRPAQVTSLNFAGFSAFHNYPTGKASGNHWGEAVALLRTSSGAPYYFNFHRADLGNTMIIGPSGSGKTVAQGFLLAMLEKHKPTGVFFDKDRGAEIFIRAQRGQYHPLTLGDPTGWNPFQLDNTPANLAFLRSLLDLLARRTPDTPLTAQEDAELSLALSGVMMLDKPMRRLQQILSFLNVTNQEGVYYRLMKWCSGGPLGWLFDNDTDNLDMSSSRLFGFDMTQLLDAPEVCAPALFYLMHRMEEVIDGRRFVGFMDEFWKLLMNQVFETFAQNKLKTIRKLNGFLVFGTQDPKDTLDSPIAHTIIGQCPTMLFMPNPKANYEHYVKGFHLSERELEIVRTLPENSRRFLIKQGHNSVVAELNLNGFGDELAVLSGTASNVELLQHVMADVGTDPDAWLPVFQSRRAGA